MRSTREVGAMLKRIDGRRSRLMQEAGERASAERIAVRSLPVTCRECRKRSPLHRWTFIQHRSYTQPHGCTEGDYWTNDNVRFCHIACPGCGERSYLYTRHDCATVVAAIQRISDRQSVFDAKIVVEADPQRSW